MRGPSCSQSSENINKCVFQLVEDKWEIIDVISIEDESVDNGACNVALLLKNGTLQESGGNKIQYSVTSIDLDYITLSEEESFSHEDNDNSQVVYNADKESLRDVRLCKKIDSCLANESGNIEEACSNEGISSILDHKHLDRFTVTFSAGSYQTHKIY